MNSADLTKSIKGLDRMFAHKWGDARANGANDEQAIAIIRQLWIEHLTEGS